MIMIKEAVAKADDAAALYRMVRRNPNFLRQIIKQWVYDTMREKGRKHRKLIWDRNEKGHQEAMARVQDLERAVAVNLMDFKLWDGTLLRDAVRPALKESSRRYESQARNMNWKADWLNLVAKNLPNDQVVVGKVLTEAKLRNMQTKARFALVPAE